MKQLSLRSTRTLQIVAIAVLAFLAYGTVRWTLAGGQVAHALPEFTARTGEQCATCHVNPGGGGPLTLPGLLWAAQGRPDEVPELPGNLVPPSITDGMELYDFACAGCHGRSGEGLSAISLAGRPISEAAARGFIARGILPLGMPAYEDELTAAQIDALAAFVAEIGLMPRIPEEFPLPAGKLTCVSAPDLICEGK